MSEAEPFIQLRGVVKFYSLGKREIRVLKGLDLDVAQGEFLALRGASGAGKSTLLHLIGGLDSPNAGEIRLAGKALHQMSAADLARYRNRQVGFVFQSYHLLPELDALENVCLPARMRGVPPLESAERARTLLHRVGLEGRLDHRPAELSGGEQQRVAIARALINEPELILADEPTGNLDSHAGASIIDLLASLHHERRATLVIATHDDSVAARAPRAVHVLDGLIASS